MPSQEDADDDEGDDDEGDDEDEDEESESRQSAGLKRNAGGSRAGAGKHAIVVRTNRNVSSGVDTGAIPQGGIQAGGGGTADGGVTPLLGLAALSRCSGPAGWRCGAAASSRAVAPLAS